MKLLKTITVALTVGLMSTTAFANETIQMVSPYKPGGGTDGFLQMVKPLLEKKGFTVNVTYLKSCAEAISMFKSTETDAQLFQVNTDYDPNNPDAKCVLDMKKDNIYPAGILYGPLAICAAKKDITKEDFLTKPFRLAVAASGLEAEILNKIVESLPNSHKVEIVPYRGGGAMQKAVLAGDVDGFFGTRLRIKSLDNVRGDCFYSTMKNDPLGIEFAGNLSNKPENFEYHNGTIIWANKNDSNAYKAMEEIFNSPELLDKLHEMTLDATRNPNDASNWVEQNTKSKF